MTTLKLKELGIEIDEDRLLEQAAEIVAERALGRYTDENGNWTEDSEAERLFNERLDKKIKARIDEAIEQIAARNVLPHIGEYIEAYCLQETNEWGEAKGKKLTFTEYLVQRAHAYLEEPVNHDGKPKDKKDSYGFRPHSTRVVFLIEKHLHYEIERAMKDALANSLGSVGKALVETTRAALKNAADRLRVDVKVN